MEQRDKMEEAAAAANSNNSNKYSAVTAREQCYYFSHTTLSILGIERLARD